MTTTTTTTLICLTTIQGVVWNGCKRLSFAATGVMHIHNCHMSIGHPWRYLLQNLELNKWWFSVLEYDEWRMSTTAKRYTSNALFDHWFYGLCAGKMQGDGGEVVVTWSAGKAGSASVDAPPTQAVPISDVAETVFLLACPHRVVQVLHMPWVDKQLNVMTQLQTVKQKFICYK